MSGQTAAYTPDSMNTTKRTAMEFFRGQTGACTKVFGNWASRMGKAFIRRMGKRNWHCGRMAALLWTTNFSRVLLFMCRGKSPRQPGCTDRANRNFHCPHAGDVM